MAEPKPDSALHLRADDVGIDRNTAIHRAPDLMDDRTFLAYRQFYDLRHIGAEALDHRDASRAAAFDFRALPVGKLSNGLKHAGMARRLAHHRKTAFNGILSRRLEQFIDERFHRVTGVGVTHRTPPQHGDAHIDLMQVAFKIGDLVGDVMRALIGCRIQAVLERHRLKRRTLHDRLADDGVAPGFDPPVARDPAHAMNPERPVIAAPHVILARPHQLHRFARADRLHHFGKFNGDVRSLLRTAAEAAAGKYGLQMDPVHPDAENFTDRGLIRWRKLA